MLSRLFFTIIRQYSSKNPVHNPCIKCSNLIITPFQKMEQILENNSYNLFNNSKCKVFSKQNVVIKNELAINCRLDKSKCGIDGKHFNPIRG